MSRFDGSTSNNFYVILKVEGLDSQRPYIIKDSAQIFVRIGGSTRPASRTTIANLFVNLLERRNSIRKLQVYSMLLRNELTAQVIDTVDGNFTGIIPLLDLESFKDVSLSAEWFLREQNLLGDVENTGNITFGLYNNIHELNKEQMNRSVRYTRFKLVLDKWKPHHVEFKNIIASFEDITKRCANFLQSS